MGRYTHSTGWGLIRLRHARNLEGEIDEALHEIVESAQGTPEAGSDTAPSAPSSHAQTVEPILPSPDLMTEEPTAASPDARAQLERKMAAWLYLNHRVPQSPETDEVKLQLELDLLVPLFKLETPKGRGGEVEVEVESNESTRADDRTEPG